MELISVLMCVYNTEADYLKEAIDSILSQTYKNFEFIIINDCSTNKNTIKVLSSYYDYRIKIINNNYNLGLTKSLNKGLDICKGEYIARFDADDISKKDRLEKQLRYIKQYDYALIGSNYNIIPFKNNTTFMTEDFHKQKIRMIFGNAGIIHSSAFISKKELDRLDLRYNESFLRSQDYGLWCEFLNKGKTIGICPEQLLYWRVSDSQISVKFKKEQEYYCDMIRKKYIIDNFYIINDDLDFFISTINYNLYSNTFLKKDVEDLLKRLIKSNMNRYSYFKKEIYRYWILQMLLRIKKEKKVDMLFTNMTMQCLFSVNIFYVLKCFLLEKQK